MIASFLDEGFIETVGDFQFLTMCQVNLYCRKLSERAEVRRMNQRLSRQVRKAGPVVEQE